MEYKPPYIGKHAGKTNLEKDDGYIGKHAKIVWVDFRGRYPPVEYSAPQAEFYIPINNKKERKWF